MPLKIEPKFPLFNTVPFEMATLWLNKSSGCDFLISFDSKLAALEFSTKIFDKAFTVNDEEAKYTCDGLELGGVLVTSQDIPTAGICIGTLECLQLMILPAGYVPPQKVNNQLLYKRIAHVWEDDALSMIFSTNPENFYNFPSDFTMVDREEPYNFTKYLPSTYQLDEELADYMMIV